MPQTTTHSYKNTQPHTEPSQKTAPNDRLIAETGERAVTWSHRRWIAFRDDSDLPLSMSSDVQC
jgi:hypothetical protein